MATVLHRTTKQLLPSVNTPDYPVETWIRSPDLSAVAGLPSKYWKIDGDTVSAMDAAEQAAADAAETAASAAAVSASAKAQYDAEALIRAVVAVMLDEINVLRTAASLPARTPAQARTAIRAKLNGGG